MISRLYGKAPTRTRQYWGSAWKFRTIAGTRVGRHQATHARVRAAARATRGPTKRRRLAQLPTLASDAYATGQAMVALEQAKAIRVSDLAFQRGVRYLLNTQLEDGSWYVRTRSLAFQPYFESDFPHGPDQWISIAASNWAAVALAPAASPNLWRAAQLAAGASPE